MDESVLGELALKRDGQINFRRASLKKGWANQFQASFP